MTEENNLEKKSKIGEKNGKFNLPIYPVATTNKGEIPYTVMGIFLGDNPLNFNYYQFFSYDSNKKENEKGGLK